MFRYAIVVLNIVSLCNTLDIFACTIRHTCNCVPWDCCGYRCL